MPESAGFAIHEADIDDMLSMLRAYRRGELTRREPSRPDRHTRHTEHRLCILLGNLREGQSTPAWQLKRETTGRVLDVSIFTAFDVAGDLTLTWTGKDPVTFDASATAEEVYKVAKNSLGDDLIEVTLGSNVRWENDTYYPARWRFTLSSTLSDKPAIDNTGLPTKPYVRATWVLHSGTGHIFPVWPGAAIVNEQVISGSQCDCHFLPGTGWIIGETEPVPTLLGKTTTDHAKDSKEDVDIYEDFDIDTGKGDEGTSDISVEVYNRFADLGADIWVELQWRRNGWELVTAECE